MRALIFKLCFDEAGVYLWYYHPKESYYSKWSAYGPFKNKKEARQKFAELLLGRDPARRPELIPIDGLDQGEGKS
jgi:hypothetical protein